MTYSNAQEDANEIDLSLNISLATPIKNKTNPSEDNKEKESASSEETKQATDKRTRILFVHYCEIIYDIILENISDSVLRKLKNNGLTSGDGATAYKLLHALYFTGTNGLLVTNLRKLIKMKCDGIGQDAFEQYNYDFTRLMDYFKQKHCAVNDTLAWLLYLEGLGSNYDSIKKRILDDSRLTIPTLNEVMSRISYNRENVNDKGDIDTGHSASDMKTKHENKKFEYDPTKKYHCYNCGQKHIGGERKCSKACKTCGSTQHVRYDCPDRKSRRGGHRGGNGGNRNKNRHYNNNSNNSCLLYTSPSPRD